MSFLLKPAFLVTLILLPLLFFGGCGYHFPQSYDGPAQVVYMANWQNRTNRLGLDNKLYRELAVWFQKSAMITLTKNKGQADYILTGEFLAIDLPAVSWTNVTSASSAEVNLSVRYVLRDSKTGKVAWEVPSKIYSEDYSARKASSYSDEAALEKIVYDLAEDIYLGTLRQLRKQAAKEQNPQEQNAKKKNPEEQAEKPAK